jgi:hypothetical protein
MSIPTWEGEGRNWAGTCPASPALRAKAGVPYCDNILGSFIYTFSDTFFIRETEATSALFGSCLSKISIR